MCQRCQAPKPGGVESGINQLESSSRGPRGGLAGRSCTELLALAVLLGRPGLGRDRLCRPWLLLPLSLWVASCHPQIHLDLGHLQHLA